jgi:hypothetical protein
MTAQLISTRRLLQETFAATRPIYAPLLAMSLIGLLIFIVLEKKLGLAPDRCLFGFTVPASAGNQQQLLNRHLLDSRADNIRTPRTIFEIFNQRRKLCTVL